MNSSSSTKCPIIKISVDHLILKEWSNSLGRNSLEIILKSQDVINRSYLNFWPTGFSLFTNVNKKTRKCQGKPRTKSAPLLAISKGIISNFQKS